MKTINFDNVRMNVIQTASNGVVNELTIFIFSQKGSFVSATYTGGLIFQGYLVGTIEGNRLAFSFCQLQNDGKMDNGRSECDIAINDNGKIRLTEHFTWASKHDETGLNVFQEI